MSKIQNIIKKYRKQCQAKQPNPPDKRDEISLLREAQLINTLETTIKDNLSNPASPLSQLLLAYKGAVTANDNARRIFYAQELAEDSNNTSLCYFYGIELYRNGLYDRACDSFAIGFEKNNNHMGCLNGAASCHLAKLELNEAEALFKMADKIEPESFAKKNLQYIDEMIAETPPQILKERQKNLWAQYRRMEARRLSEQEQKERIAMTLIENASKI